MTTSRARRRSYQTQLFTYLWSSVSICALPLLVPNALAAPRISIPAPVVWTNSISGNATAIKVAGDYAYVALDSGSFLVADVADHARPSPLGHCSIPGNPLSLALAEPYAYVASSSNGLQVVEVQDPAHPLMIGGADAGGLAWDVQVRGRYAYVTVRELGLVVFDLEIPGQPRRVGTFPFSTPSARLDVVSNLVYIAASDRLIIVDAADPAHPVQAGEFKIQTADPISDVRVLGRHAFVSGRGLGVLDIGDPARVVPVATAPRFYTSTAVRVAGRYAVIAEQFDRLVVFDITDPEHPKELGEVYAGFKPGDFDIANNVAYLAVTESGVLLVDLSDPTQPIRTGGIGLGGSIRSVRVADGYAFAADSRAGLSILDVSNPSQPRLAAGYFTGGSISGLELAGHTLFLSVPDYGLVSLDVTSPADPRVLGRVTDAPAPNSFQLAHGLALVASASSLQIRDASDPTNMPIVGTWDVEPSYGYAFGVGVAGHRAYVGVDLDPGLVQDVVDITDPAHPVFLGVLGDPDHSLVFAIAVAEVGDYVVLMDTTADLKIYDGRGPGLPILAGHFPTRFAPFSLRVEGERLYVSELGFDPLPTQQGVEIIDVSNPPHLRSLGFLSTPDLVETFMAGGHLYAAGWNHGLAIVPSIPGVSLTLQVEAAPGLPLVVETAADLGRSSVWRQMLTTNVTSSPVWITDPNASASSKFYRARQPSE